MATTSYKCPSCGAGIHFKPALKKFKCDFCLNEYTESDLINESDKQKDYDTHEHEHSDELLNVYNCKSCGAEVVTDETTTSTFCYYCHNPVIISSRLKGEFLPNKIIPFKLDKDRAKETFLKWVGRKRFIPRDFTSSSQLEKITGIYLPYWWVDYEADVDYVGEGLNIRVWRVGNREYTETKKYEVVRKGKIDINNVAELAFTKISKDLLNGIGPYEESEAIPFSKPYLSGFFAEQYDIEKEKIEPFIEEQVNRYNSYLISESIQGYNNVSSIKNDINLNAKSWNYTLLPAWILTYIYNGKTYVFAVNGQNGRAYGELPVSNTKLSKAFGGIFAATFAILLLGGMFIW
ncbi:MAG: hypothetical protein RIN55_08365 [Tissierellaceae bacterium]|nr:hypothetical protein [Tissierellaceae bacterium]